MRTDPDAHSREHALPDCRKNRVAPLTGPTLVLAGLLTTAACGANKGNEATADRHFVDVYSASQGLAACAPDGQRWVDGQTHPAVVPYHPNTKGMRAQARPHRASDPAHPMNLNGIPFTFLAT